MGVTNLDSLTLSGKLVAPSITNEYTDIAVSGDADIVGDVTAGGSATLGSLVVTEATTVGTTLGVTGKSTLASVEVTGATTVGTTLGVTGVSTLTGGAVVPTGGAVKVEDITDLTFAVATEDATDEASAVALANDIKAQYNALITYLRTGALPT